MSLPLKHAVEIDENITHYEFKLLDQIQVLKYDESKCVECGFCHRVCPVTISIYDEPLKRTAIGTPIEMKMESDKKIVVDTEKCVWCGTCDWCCPTHALELLLNGEHKINLVENGSLPEFDSEERTMEDGREVRKIVEGSITFTSTEKDKKVIDTYCEECAVGALSRKDSEIEVDKDLCILCYKCSEAAQNYDNISVEVHRDRFMKVKGDPSSIWNGVMLRVLGKEGKIKGIISRSQNKLTDAVLRLLGREGLEEES
ncbi:MAG: 4Fe-4S binding protein [Promethearchaeota archaeon]|jgi:Fe-S-cluster-containing hydrogenase component 2